MSTRSARYSLLTIANKNSDSLAVRDRDAMAFIDAAELGDDLHQYAIRELVRSLKRAGLWSKMKAIYPFIGGTASAHKWNLKDPRDLDAAFRLSFNGGWTHSSTGAQPNGTTGYADTFFDIATNFTLSNHHACVYLRTNSDGSTIDIGGRRGNEALSGNRYVQIYPRFNNLCYINSGDNFFPNFANTDSRGFYLLCKRSNTTLDGFVNNVQKMDNVTSGTGQAFGLANVYLGACSFYDLLPNVLSGSYSNRQQAFASLGDSLSDAEATGYYNIVQRYQTTLGRNV